MRSSLGPPRGAAASDHPIRDVTISLGPPSDFDENLEAYDEAEEIEGVGVPAIWIDRVGALAKFPESTLKASVFTSGNHPDRATSVRVLELVVG
jgi:hypothetical protein